MGNPVGFRGKFGFVDLMFYSFQLKLLSYEEFHPLPTSHESSLQPGISVEVITVPCSVSWGVLICDNYMIYGGFSSTYSFLRLLRITEINVAVSLDINLFRCSYVQEGRFQDFPALFL